MKRTKEQLLEVVSNAIEQASAANKTMGARRTAANAAFAALRELAALPPADAGEAEERGYRIGMLRALELAKAAREQHESRVAEAEQHAGAAGTVLNGVRNYGQFIYGTLESLVQRHLIDRHVSARKDS